MKVTAAIITVLAAFLLQACGSSGPARSEVLFHAEATDFLGFHSTNQHEGGFRANASFDSNTRGSFGQDLISAAGVVPIKATIFWSEPDSIPGVSFEIKESSMNPKLYLQDGTALTRVGIAQMRERVKKKLRGSLDQLEFSYSGLSPKIRPDDEGYIYFALPIDSTVDGSQLLFTGLAGEVHSVDIRRSLLSFSYIRRIDSIRQLMVMNVGLKK